MESLTAEMDKLKAKDENQIGKGSVDGNGLDDSFNCCIFKFYMDDLF